MAATKAELAALSDEVWERTRRRVEGLTDDEYLWEPAPGCWTIRPRPDGVWRADWPLPAPEPAPFTTIAWRLWHLVDMYGEDRGPRFFDIPPDGPAYGYDDPDGQPSPGAAGAIEVLELAHARWDRHLTAVTEESLGAPVGSVGGPWADRTRGAFVLHMLDEFVHHGAEIGLLRDLWRAQRGTYVDDPLEERVVRGDATVVEEVSASPSRSRSGLVALAAAYGRWDLAVALARLGAPLESTRPSALHLAAGAGELAVAQELVELGADPSATDPQFHATPLQWARFLRRPAVEEWLSTLTTEG